MNWERLFEGLTDEQIEKARLCKNHEELLRFVEEEGLELNEEQLAAVSGGAICESEDYGPSECPFCGSIKIVLNSNGNYMCWDCGKTIKKRKQIKKNH